MAHLQKLIPVSPGVIGIPGEPAKPIFDGLGILHVHVLGYEHRGYAPCIYCREPPPAELNSAAAVFNAFEMRANERPCREPTMENVCPVGTMRLQANDLWIGDNFIRQHIVKLIPEEFDGT